MCKFRVWKKIFDCYLFKIKLYLCLFIALQVHLEWGIPCQGKSSSLGSTMVGIPNYCPTRVGVQKNVILDADLLYRSCDQNNKHGGQFM